MVEHREIFVSEPEAQERASIFAEIQKQLSEHAHPETPVDTELYEAWKQVVPRSNWGEISVSTAYPGFQAGFESSLRDGTNAEFIADSVDIQSDAPFAHIYAIRAQTPEELPSASQKIWHNYTSEALDTTQKKLEAFDQIIDENNLPAAYRTNYHDKVTSNIDAVQMGRSIGTPEFTRAQRRPGEWATLLDLEETQRSGVAQLRYESQARDLLERGRKISSEAVSMTDALSVWNLSAEELQESGLSLVDQDAAELTPEQGRQLFVLLFKRVGLEPKIVESDRTLISFNPKSGELEFPKNRRLSTKDIPFVPFHEMIHAIRGANGSRQKAQVLSEGEEGYLMTEEGVTTVAEMVMGQPFGHSRQMEFAARYLAVALAMKTKRVEGELEAAYSAQDIHNELVQYGIDPDTASKTVWRVMRGTSLTRQITDIDVGDNDNRIFLQIPEVYAKDAVYFEGMMKLFEWMRASMPIASGMRRDVTTAATDFSDDTVRRIGTANLPEGITIDSIADLKREYHNLAGYGKEALLTLLQYLVPGKLTFESLHNEDSPWKGLITRSQEDGLVQVRDLLQQRNS